MSVGLQSDPACSQRENCLCHTFHSNLWWCTVFCSFHSFFFWVPSSTLAADWKNNNNKAATTNKTLKLNQYLLTQSSTTTSTIAKFAFLWSIPLYPEHTTVTTSTVTSQHRFLGLHPGTGLRTSVGVNHLSQLLIHLTTTCIFSAWSCSTASISWASFSKLSD